MDPDLIIGVAITLGALAAIIFLSLWSRRSIDRVARNGYGSARKIIRDRHRG